MAVSYERYDEGVHGHQRFWQGEVTFDASYPTNGEVIAPADFSMSSVTCLMVAGAVGNLDLTVHWDKANAKLKASVSSTGLEVAAAVDLSAVTATLMVYGH